MTWAQATFAYCFAVLVPVAGFLFAKRRRQQGRSGIGGFFLGSGAMFLALVGCCLLAVALFPKYPAVPTSEWLANAFTLPAIAVVLLILWWPRPAVDQKKLVVRWSAIFLAFYVAGVVFTFRMTLWPYRAALPWNAREIRETAITDILLPDYDYWMTARISEEQFREYIRHFDLKRSRVELENSAEARGVQVIYGRKEERSGMEAKYEKGYIHVRAWRE